VIFYLALPLLSVLALRLGRRSRWGHRRPWLVALVPPVVLLAVGEAGQRLAQHLPRGDGGSWSGSWHAVVARGFPAQAGLFAAGLALAVLYAQVDRNAVRLPSAWRPVTVCLAAGVALPALFAEHAGRVNEHRASLLVSVACAAVLLLVVVPSPGDARPVMRFLDSPGARWAGLASYSVFLWNEPLVHWLRRHDLTGSSSGAFWIALAETFAVLAVVGFASWRLVEKPALRWKASSVAVGATDVLPHQRHSDVELESQATQADTAAATTSEVPGAPRPRRRD
jgi:peptidoglycan/LPS O-acetylase OafA/YrhL